VCSLGSRDEVTILYDMSSPDLMCSLISHELRFLIEYTNVTLLQMAESEAQKVRDDRISSGQRFLESLRSETDSSLRIQYADALNAGTIFTNNIKEMSSWLTGEDLCSVDRINGVSEYQSQ
jgi:hypothetical protein